MEGSEDKALEQAAYKLQCWYVDDTFVIWPHGLDRLTEFVNHLTTSHKNIQFTMELGDNGHLDIDTYRRPDGTLGHKVYRKPTHSNFYLHLMLHHHTAKMHAALTTLTHTAWALCDKGSLDQNQNSSRPLLWTMVTITSRFSRLSNQLIQPPRLRQNQIWLLFYHMCRPPLANSADCLLNITSEAVVYYQG